MNKILYHRNELLAQTVIAGLKSRNMSGYYAGSKEEALALALEQCRVNISAMAQLSKKSVSKAVRLLTAWSPEGFDAVKQMEDDADVYEDRLGAYITGLTGREMTPRQNAAAAEYLRSLTDYERISDHALNLAENAKEIQEKQIRLTDDAKHELEVLSAAVNEILHLSVRAFDADDAESAAQVEPLEEVIDDLCDEIKSRHIERVAAGRCPYRQGYVYNDILTNLERVADHCSNLAIAVIERRQNAYDAHDYVTRVKTDESFRATYAEFKQRYSL